MIDENAQALLAKVMGWNEGDAETVQNVVPKLQLLADHKYDQYQRFAPGKRFIESLALWLNEFNASDRPAALKFVLEDLVFFSEAEISHIVQTAYPDVVVPQRARLVSEEENIPPFKIGAIVRHRRFEELRLKSLYLGLSDGARTNELRRASQGEINNEQIWQAYELGPEKVDDMLGGLRESLEKDGFNSVNQKFTLVWLLDDFSGSGNTYIRFDDKGRKFKGKIKKIYEQLAKGNLVETAHYQVFLLLYIATRQAIDHIEYWSERFTSENGFNPLELKVLCTIERDSSVANNPDPEIQTLLKKPEYADDIVVDKHFLVGGTSDPRLGFAGCALPVVLSHNTPNNSVFLLWGPEGCKFSGLFPRVSRHREF